MLAIVPKKASVVAVTRNERVVVPESFARAVSGQGVEALLGREDTDPGRAEGVDEGPALGAEEGGLGGAVERGGQVAPGEGGGPDDGVVDGGEVAGDHEMGEGGSVVEGGVGVGVGADAVDGLGGHAGPVGGALVHGLDAVGDPAGVDVADVGVLATPGVDSGGTDVADVGGGSGGVLPGDVVAKEDVPAGVAVGGIGAEVGGPVPLEEGGGREAGVVAIDGALLPSGDALAVGVVGVVVGDDVSPTRVDHDDGLVEVHDDVVLDKVLGAGVGHGDAVGAAAGVDGRGVVDVGVSNLVAEGAGEEDVDAGHAV